MISCTEFIPAYSELFKSLEKKYGKAVVIKYWEHISDDGLDLLKKEVIKNGIRGCFNYWSHTLNEEAADFTMMLDEDKNEFSIDMHSCPSKGLLLSLKHMKPYHDYCGHCDVLYKRALAPLGYTCTADLSKCDKAQCFFRVTKD